MDWKRDWNWVTALIVGSLVIVLGMIFALSGCGGRKDSADEKQKQKTEAFMKEAEAQIGMPAVRNFQERKLAKMIFELRDREDLICYAYLFNRMNGKLVFVGKCIGFGLPYSVQYTNPQKIADSYSQGGFAILPQADPNGLFMPSGLSATWLMMIDPKTNDPRPVYFEPQIVVALRKEQPHVPVLQ